MRKQCEGCGEEFEAKRKQAKYCGDRCRQRGHRRPRKLAAVPDPAPAADPAPQQPAASWDDDGLAAATRRSLEKVDRLDSDLGAAAMLLARRLDAVSAAETGGGVASLMREYRATLAEATRDAGGEQDELDQIRGSAALKLIGGRGA